MPSAGPPSFYDEQVPAPLLHGHTLGKLMPDGVGWTARPLMHPQGLRDVRGWERFISPLAGPAPTGADELRDRRTTPWPAPAEGGKPRGLQPQQSRGTKVRAPASCCRFDGAVKDTD